MAEQMFKVGDRIRRTATGPMATVLRVSEARFDFRYDGETLIFGGSWHGDHGFTLVKRPKPEQEPEQVFKVCDRILGMGTGWTATVKRVDDEGFDFTYDGKSYGGRATWTGHAFTRVERPEPEPEKTTTYRVVQVLKRGDKESTVSYYTGDNLAIAISALANAAIPPERDVYRIVSVTMTVEDD